MNNNSNKKIKVCQRKDGITVGKFWGEQDEKAAREFIEEITKLAKLGGKVKFFIDGSEAGKSTAGARKAYVDFAKSVPEGKIAIFGVTTLLKVIATFIIRAAGTKNVKFFTNKGEAIKWLKE